MIQSVMLALLGFLAATLLALLIAPAYWARAVRLTTRNLRRALPISESEIRADKDLMRAEYALRVHQLERQVEQARLSAHRHVIEINRREVAISRLDGDILRLEAELTENRNARAVLEQTVHEQIPRLEAALREARGMLAARDRELALVNQTADRQAHAIEDANALMTQRVREIQRLQSALADREAQDRTRHAEFGVEAGFALRSEVETLRSRVRDQASLIERLEGEVALRAPGLLNGHARAGEAADGDVATLRGRIAQQSAEIRQLQKALQAAGPSAGEPAGPPANAAGAETGEARERALALEVLNREQAEEIARLKEEARAASEATDPTAAAAVRESKVWLKSRLERTEDELRRERDTTGRLKAELASSNERAARQASYFRDEVRRLGNRTLVPASRGSRAGEAAPQTGTRTVRPIRPARPAGQAAPATLGGVSPRALELQRALLGAAFGTGEAGGLADAPAPSASAGAEAPGQATADGSPPAAGPPDAASGEAASPARAGRLLQRLKSYEQA